MNIQEFLNVIVLRLTFLNVHQVDRGASIGWLSQYPKESETLFPPLSNIEVTGQPKMESVILQGMKGAMVTLIKMRINANNKSLTLGELDFSSYLHCCDALILFLHRSAHIKAARP